RIIDQMWIGDERRVPHRLAESGKADRGNDLASAILNANLAIQRRHHVIWSYRPLRVRRDHCVIVEDRLKTDRRSGRLDSRSGGGTDGGGWPWRPEGPEQ